jgi:hypothetical protein
MDSLKNRILKQGLKWMSDPRVAKLMQDERLMKAVMAAVAMPGRAQGLAKDVKESVARALALATEGEVTDLRRTLRKLEDELARMKRGESEGAGATKRNAAE